MSPLPLHLSTSYVYYILFLPLFQASSSFLSPSISSSISSFPSSTSLISSPLSLYPEQNSSIFQITFSFIPTPPPPLFHLPPSIPFPLVVLSFLKPPFYSSSPSFHNHFHSSSFCISFQFLLFLAASFLSLFQFPPFMFQHQSFPLTPHFSPSLSFTPLFSPVYKSRGSSEGGGKESDGCVVTQLESLVSEDLKEVTSSIWLTCPTQLRHSSRQPITSLPAHALTNSLSIFMKASMFICSLLFSPMFLCWYPFVTPTHREILFMTRY